jgi:predicted transcriptional regulator
MSMEFVSDMAYNPCMEDITDEADIGAQLEIALVEEARADVRAGRIVPFRAVKAWVQSLDTPWELPPPRSSGKAPG